MTTAEQLELANLRNIVGAMVRLAGGDVSMSQAEIAAVHGWTYYVYQSADGTVRIVTRHSDGARPHSVVKGSVVKEDGEEGEPDVGGQPEGPFLARGILGGHVRDRGAG